MENSGDKTEQDVQDVFWMLIDELLYSLATEECHEHRQDTIEAVCKGQAMKCQARKEKPKPEMYTQHKKATVNDTEKAVCSCNCGGQNNSSSNRYTRLSIGRPPCEQRSRSTCSVILSDEHNYNDETRSAFYEEALKADNDDNDVESTEFDIRVMINSRKEESPPHNELLWRKAVKNTTLQTEEADTETESVDNDDIISQLVEKTKQNEATFHDIEKQLVEAKVILDGPTRPGDSIGNGESGSSCELVTISHRVLIKDKKANPRLGKRRKRKGKGSSTSLGKSKTAVRTKGPREARSVSERSMTTDNHGLHLPLIDNPSQVDVFTKPITGGHGSCDDKLQRLIECSEITNPKTAVSQHMCRFDKSKKHYDNVLKQRSSCCTRLQTLSKQITNNKLNPRIILSHETMRQYFSLKSEYLKICCLESSLRQHMAKLQGEIFAIKNKRPRKPTASVHTITLDSTTTSLASEFDIPFMDKGPVFPSLQQPRPLLFPHQKDYVRYNWQTRIAYPMKPEWGEGKSVDNVPKPRRLGICYQDEDKQTPYVSLYNLSPSMEPYPIKNVPLKKPVHMHALCRNPCSCMNSLE